MDDDPEDPGSSQRRGHIRDLLRQKKSAESAPPGATGQVIPEKHYRFEKDPEILGLIQQQADLKARDLENPYFKQNDGIARGTTNIDGRLYVNFANYNYLGLAGDDRVSQAAKAAIAEMGTSVSASRIASGERSIQRQLEQSLASVHDVPDCVVFVSGHATNVTTIGHLFGSKDLILHDELAHNSALQGAILSGARRLSFPHNDHNALELLLAEHRASAERVLIFIEGVYSMDGDFPDLPRFVDLRNRYKTYLMVDEAHSMGVLGDRGFGIREHFGLAGSDVDLWMGTLSKTLASCGGYIAGRSELVEYLKYSAPGFLYSVGITPANAAASYTALEVMIAEPERVTELRARSNLFRDLACQAGLDVGLSRGSSVVPVILRDSMLSIALSNRLFSKGINVQPILYPAVEENEARLRFFITSAHTEDQIRMTIDTIVTCLNEVKGFSRITP